MKKIVIMLLIICGSVSVSVAQENVADSTAAPKWFLSTSATYGSNIALGPEGMMYDLTVGRFLGDSGILRADGYFGYLVDPKFANVGVGVLMLTVWDGYSPSVGSFYYGSSLGFGVMSNQISSKKLLGEETYTTAVAAVRIEVGYKINKLLSVGVHISSYLNLADIRNRTITASGISLGFRF